MDFQINGLDSESVRGALTELKRYQSDVDRKMQRVCEKLAHIGQATASVGFSNAIYDGTNDVSVVAEPFGNGWRVHASGQATLFIEFGSGTIGYGHPQPQEYGPGTWSDGANGKHHWQDPNGWYYAHGKKSWGNPPAMAMYRAEQDIKREIERVVSEVFGTA